MTTLDFGTVAVRTGEAPQTSFSVATPSSNSFVYKPGTGVGYVSLGFEVLADARITFGPDASTPGLTTLDAQLAARLGWGSDGNGGFAPAQDQGAVLLPGAYAFVLYEGGDAGHSETLAFNLSSAGGGAGAGPGAGSSGGAPAAASSPDFTATAEGLSHTLAQPGDPVAVNGRVANDGTRAGAAGNIGYYLSTDRRITTEDRFLGQITRTDALDPGQSIGLSTQVTLPSNLAPGTYYLGFIPNADGGNAAETDRSDNASAGLAIDVVASTPGSAGGAEDTGGDGTGDARYFDDSDVPSFIPPVDDGHPVAQTFADAWNRYGEKVFEGAGAAVFNLMKTTLRQERLPEWHQVLTEAHDQGLNVAEALVSADRASDDQSYVDTVATWVARAERTAELAVAGRYRDMKTSIDRFGHSLSSFLNDQLTFVDDGVSSIFDQQRSGGHEMAALYGAVDKHGS